MDAPVKQPVSPRAADEIAEQDIKLDSVTLTRLIEEVRNEEAKVGRNYDRTYNRHNR
jgi:hypothetical protein